MAQNLKINILARDKTKQAFNGIRGRLAGLKNAVLSVKGALVGIGAGIVIKQFVDVGRTVEDLQVRLKQLFGSTQEGAKAFDVMANFAAKVPFSLEQIQAASGNLAVVAGDADRLSKILEITGNVAAVTGLDFQTTGEQIQRSFSAGIASADIFRERGVRDMLGFSAGATVSAEETIAAFERVFGKGGKFGNATDELANTFTGTLSMLSDSVFKFQKRVADAEFFSALKKEFKDLDTFIKENEATFNDIADAIGFVLTGALKLLSTGIKALAKAVDAVTIAYEHLISAVNFVLPKQLEIQIKTKEQRELERQIGEIEKERFLRLKGILKEQNKITKSLNIQKNTVVDVKKVEEAIAKAREKDRTRELFLQVETNKKRLKFHELISNEKTTLEKIQELFNEQKESFSFTNMAVDFLNRGIDSFSRGLAESLVLGKSLKDTFSNMAKALAVEVLSAIISIVAQKGVELAIEKLITREKQKQVALSKASTFSSFLNPLSFIGGFFGFGKQSGGAVRKGQPTIVGERGAEMFIPNSSGQITQSARGVGGGAVNVNFNINTVDASGFEELLVRSRGTITQLINNAVNEKGRSSII